MVALQLSSIPAFIMGFGTLFIGIAAFFLPGLLSNKFGIAVTEEKALSYVRSTGARDVFIGLMLIALAFEGVSRDLALMSFSTALVAVCDSWVVNRYGEKRAATLHLAGALFALSYGVWLLF